MKTVNDIKIALDPDTMINVINNDPEHIRRAKEKAERIKQQKGAEIFKSVQEVIEKAQKQEAAEKKKAQRQEARQRDIDDKATLAVLTTAIAFVAQTIAMMF